MIIDVITVNLFGYQIMCTAFHESRSYFVTDHVHLVTYYKYLPACFKAE